MPANGTCSEGCDWVLSVNTALSACQKVLVRRGMSDAYPRKIFTSITSVAASINGRIFAQLLCIVHFGEHHTIKFVLEWDAGFVLLVHIIALVRWG